MSQQVPTGANWTRALRVLAAIGVALTVTWMALIGGMVSQHMHAQTVDVLTGPHSAVLAHEEPMQANADESLVERLCDALRNCPCSSTWADRADLGTMSTPPAGIANWPPPKPLRSVIYDVPDPPPEVALALTGDGFAATDLTRWHG